MSATVGVVGILWGFSLGGTQALASAIDHCSSYRTEVLALADRGLSQQQIVGLLSLEDYQDWTTLTGKLGASGLEVNEQNCGSVARILAIAGANSAER